MNMVGDDQGPYSPYGDVSSTSHFDSEDSPHRGNATIYDPEDEEYPAYNHFMQHYQQRQQLDHEADDGPD